MPPAQRRAAIIEATLPLLREHGANLTTRQVAEACGIAEGTIFRAFDSLPALIEAVVIESLATERVTGSLMEAELGATLEAKTHATLTLMLERIATIRSLMMLIHGPRKSTPRHPNPCLKEQLDQRNSELRSWLTEQFEEHESELTCPVVEFVDLLSLLSLGNAMNFSQGSTLDIDKLTVFALHGTIRKDTL